LESTSNKNLQGPIDNVNSERSYKTVGDSVDTFDIEGSRTMTDEFDEDEQELVGNDDADFEQEDEGGKGVVSSTAGPGPAVAAAIAATPSKRGKGTSPKKSAPKKVAAKPVKAVTKAAKPAPKAAKISPKTVTKAPATAPRLPKGKGRASAVSVDQMRRVAGLLKMASDPTRIMLLQLVGDSERSVGSMATELGLSQPSVSHHLALLRASGVFDARREGKSVFYSLGDKGDGLSILVQSLSQQI
jgi:DNA-binding transcriptional ArsR family regulator